MIKLLIWLLPYIKENNHSENGKTDALRGNRRLPFRDRLLATYACHFSCGPSNMITKQWRKVYSNDEEDRSEATIDIHVQQIYGSWEMEKRVVTDEGGGGQWVNPKWEGTEKSAYYPSRTISGLRESMGLDSVEEAGGTAMVEKRNGQHYMEESIPKQHLPNWRVQWPQRRDFHVYCLEFSM